METKVGVKEFRAHLPAYLDSVSPIAITRHGETIGYYIPAHPGRNQAELDALKQAAAQLEAMMSALGVSEDDIVAEFKTRRTTDKR
ncbi:MAG: type II toxin-antitoxin system Phd/YefM family antitoxin [Methylococcaceae bacterium]|nr:type II toxin-antitoxin system Phd/YefM family antitoxin [Methylococcaceae bacterium]